MQDMRNNLNTFLTIMGIIYVIIITASLYNILIINLIYLIKMNETDDRSKTTTKHICQNTDIQTLFTFMTTTEALQTNEIRNAKYDAPNSNI